MTLQLALDMNQGCLFDGGFQRRCPYEVLVFAGGGDGATILSSVHLPVCSRNGPDAVLPPPSVGAIRHLILSPQRLSP